MTTTPSPLYPCETLPQLGGFRRLRLAYSKDIVQQEDQTEVELPSIIFRSIERWIADYVYADKFMGDLKTETSLTDFGMDEKISFKSVHEVDADPRSFKTWFDRSIKGRRFALELTNNNDFVRVLNPFMITYIYVGTGEFQNLNRYELTYTRVRLVEFGQELPKFIERIISRKFNYAGTVTNEVTVMLFSGISMPAFDFGYSLSNDFNTIVYQNTPASNVLHNLVDGTYFFFAVNRAAPQYFDVMQANIAEGEITIIEDFTNPQIITEDETLIDEGTFVAE
jgi:hypothetical protein